MLVETWSFSNDNIDIPEYNLLFSANCNQIKKPYGISIYLKQKESGSVFYEFNNEELSVGLFGMIVLYALVIKSPCIEPCAGRQTSPDNKEIIGPKDL
jgi:hypothetical protein